MVQFLLKRLIGFLFVLLGVSFITFIIGYFAPIDQIRQLHGAALYLSGLATVAPCLRTGSPLVSAIL